MVFRVRVWFCLNTVERYGWEYFPQTHHRDRTSIVSLEICAMNLWFRGKDSVRVGMVFRVRVWFCLNITEIVPQ